MRDLIRRDALRAAVVTAAAAAAPASLLHPATAAPDAGRGTALTGVRVIDATGAPAEPGMTARTVRASARVRRRSRPGGGVRAHRYRRRRHAVSRTRVQPPRRAGASGRGRIVAHAGAAGRNRGADASPQAAPATRHGGARKAADLVVLDAKPLADIRNTTRIQVVVVRGRLSSADDRTRLLADIEQAAKEETPAGFAASAPVAACCPGFVAHRARVQRKVA